MAAIKEYLKLVDTLEFNGTVPPGICYRGFNLSKIAKDLGICLGSSLAAVHYNSIDSKIRKKIQDYIEEKVKPVPIEFLFRNLAGAMLGTRHAFRIIQRIGRGAGIKDLHPHTLRHSYATSLRRKGADLLLIKEALGHASVMTTEIYAHLGNEEYKTKLRELIN